MRCHSCNYCVWDYSENYETCFLGIESFDNGKTCGCRYREKTLDKWAKELEEMEAEEYKRMGEYFMQMEKEKADKQ